MNRIMSWLVPLAALSTCSATARASVEVEAFLYNPTASKIVLHLPGQNKDEVMTMAPTLTLWGRGSRNGDYTLRYTVEGVGGKLAEGSAAAKVQDGWFMQDIEQKEALPQARSVSWELTAADGATERGTAALKWSRFHGKVQYKDGKRRHSYIDMNPITWGAPGEVTIPVAEDGSFDALVPARVYATVNVNGAGYSYDSLERWAWDYDLTRDREDTFTLDRMELYSIHAFEIRGGPPTLFICFRPTALSRVLQFDKDGDGVLNDEERKGMGQALRRSPTAIGPELKASDVKVWVDGKAYSVIQLNQIPEWDGDGMWQVQYVVQIMPERKLTRFVWHEIKLEVESQEELQGKKIADFGQGSVGLRL